MNQHEVTFCSGCGKVFDQAGHEEAGGQWVELRDYETRYGFRWDDLGLVQTFCPGCRIYDSVNSTLSADRAASL